MPQICRVQSVTLSLSLSFFPGSAASHWHIRTAQVRLTSRLCEWQPRDIAGCLQRPRMRTSVLTAFDVSKHDKLCRRPPQNAPAPSNLTFWPWKWCSSHVWRGLPLCQYFSDLSVLDLGPMYATNRRQTSDRQMSDAHHRLMPPTLGARHNNERLNRRSRPINTSSLLSRTACYIQHQWAHRDFGLGNGHYHRHSEI